METKTTTETATEETQSKKMDMAIYEKIKKAKIKIQAKSPFLAHLSLYLKEEPDLKGELPDFAGMGVNAHGEILYSEKFVNNLPDEELQGCIIHEIFHLCLTGESLVLTAEGLKPIKDIKIGDKVFSNRGLLTEVTGVSERDYTGNIHTIKSRMGLSCSFTPNHPILAKPLKDFRKGWGFKKSFENETNEHKNNKICGVRFIPAEKLKENDSLVFPIPRAKDTHKTTKLICKLRQSYDFKKIWLDKDLAYFIGYFVGNGSLHRVKKTGKWLKNTGKCERNICITNHENKKKDNGELMSIISNKIYRSPCKIKVKEKKAIRIIFSCFKLARFLRKNFYDKNGKKSIPVWFLNEKKEIIESFIRGLTDSDGHTKKNSVSITSCYRGVYSFLPILLLKIGKSFSFSKYKNEYGDVFSVGYRKDRKRDYCKFVGNKVFYPISKIEKKKYTGKVYNLETKAHTYCCPYFVVHNCSLHLTRRGTRNQILFNIACDIIANYLLMKNNFKLPQGSLVPDTRYGIEDKITLPITMFGKVVVIKDLNKKSAEDIYEELPKIKGGGGSGNGKGEGEGEIIKGGWGFDEHREGKESKDGQGKKGKNKSEGKGRRLTEAEIHELEEKWKQRIEDAIMQSKGRGENIGGIERYFDKIKKAQVNWKSLLQNYIQNVIPSDLTFSKRHKKSYACGFYLPAEIKEKIEISSVIDVSGSIGNKEMTDFTGEIVGIATAFRERIDMRLMTHDTKVNDDYEVKNGNIDKIKKIKIHGGGGTDFDCVIEYIDKKYRNKTKCLIFLTDGQGTEINRAKVNYPIIWILCPNGSDNIIKKYEKYGDKIIWLR